MELFERPKKTDIGSVYKKDKNKKIRIVNIYVIGTSVIWEHGQLNGKLIKEHYIAKPKNIGKANATTAEEQAILEARSKFENYRLDGYKSSEDLNIKEDEITEYRLYEALSVTTDKHGFIKPMKAQQETKERTIKGEKVKVPRIADNEIDKYYFQLKLNGQRGFTFYIKNLNKIRCHSKNGIELNTIAIGHIIDDFTKLFDNITNKNLIFDGEFYSHGMALEEIASAIRTPSLVSNTVKFVVFDIVDSDNLNIKFKNRFKLLEKLEIKIKELNLINIEVEKGIRLKTKEELDNYLENAFDNKYEGLMARHEDNIYEPGVRSNTMIKFKKLEDSEFRVLDIIDSEADPNCAIFVVQNDINGEVFRSVPKASLEKRKEIYFNKSKYINSFVKIEYRDRNKKGIPCHTNVIGFRDIE